MGLLITLIVGLFTLLGSVIVIKTNNSKKIVDLSISIGFGVISALILFDLLPECFEIIDSKFSLGISLLIVLILVLLGIGILKLLDKFIPDHDTHNKNNLIHVGLITSLALFIHNFLEGMVIFTSFNGEIRFGIMLGLGVAMHNIPLGMSITSFYYKKGWVKALILSLIVSLSTFIGGLFAFIFNGIFIEKFISGIILSITLGMLLYIALFELLPHILEKKEKRDSLIGILLGFLILLVSILLWYKNSIV